MSAVYLLSEEVCTAANSCKNHQNENVWKAGRLNIINEKYIYDAPKRKKRYNEYQLENEKPI